MAIRPLKVASKRQSSSKLEKSRKW